METIMDILRKSVEKRKNEYQAKGIEKVIIDGNEFTDYKAFSFLWEKSYVKSPERSGDGTIGNLNSYATFVTPHLKIDFSVMSIESYRKLMTLLYERNEHIVQCYDIVRNEPTTNNMYFATEEMPKLWAIARALNGENWVELLGVEDYTVELIGTNTNFEDLDLTYQLNIPKDIVFPYKKTVTVKVPKNTTVNIGAGAVIEVDGTNQSFTSITFGDTYIFNGWNTNADGTGINYFNNEEYYLMGNTTLYAQWKSRV